MAQKPLEEGGGGGGGGGDWYVPSDVNGVHQRAKKKGVGNLLLCLEEKLEPVGLVAETNGRDGELEFNGDEHKYFFTVLVNESTRKKGLRYEVALGRMVRFLTGKPYPYGDTPDDRDEAEKIVRECVSLEEIKDSPGLEGFGWFRSQIEIGVASDAIGRRREKVMADRLKGQ